MFKYLIAFLFTVAIATDSTSIYGLSVPVYNADSIQLSSYAGKKILVVNTSLNCIYTYQLLGLQQLFQIYHDSLIIIAIPSNSFGNEPNNDSTIAYQMSSLFNIGFPIAAKSNVTGPDALSLFQWLTQKGQNGVIDNVLLEDFTKYLIDGSGHLIGVFRPTIEPMSSDIQDAINGIE